MLNKFARIDLLTVTVLASISVNMNSPPSKSSFIYRRALQEERTKQLDYYILTTLPQNTEDW